MAEPAAHLIDHVFPPLPARQWVLAVPKRLHYFLQRDAAVQDTVPRIFLCVVDAACATIAPLAPPPPASGRSPSCTVSAQA